MIKQLQWNSMGLCSTSAENDRTYPMFVAYEAPTLLEITVTVSDTPGTHNGVSITFLIFVNGGTLWGPTWGHSGVICTDFKSFLTAKYL